MEVKGEYTFAAPREVVWEYLQNPHVLVNVLPGCEELKPIGENEYTGTLKVKIGPVQGIFQGTVKMTDMVAPETYRIHVDGRGAPGFATGDGALRLEAQGDATLMIYSGEARIGGRIASVGQRLIDSSAKAIIKQSLDALNGIIQATAAAQLAPAAEAAAPDTPAASADASAPSDVALPRPVPHIPATYTPPSQSQLAFKVAADVMSDLIPARYQPVLAGAVGGGLVLLIYLLVRYLLFGIGR